MAKNSQKPQSSVYLRYAKRVWHKYLRDKLRLIIITFGLIGIGAAATSGYPLLIKFAFESISANAQSGIALFALGAFLVTLVNASSLYFQSLTSNLLITEVQFELRKGLYESLIDADIAQLKRQSAASHATRFSVDIGYFLSAISNLVFVAPRQIITMLALVGVMFYLDWQLTLAVMIIGPAGMWPVARIGKSLRKLATRTQVKAGEMSAKLQESLVSIGTTKSFLLEPWQKERVFAEFKTIRDLDRKSLRVRAIITPIMEFLAGLAVAGIIAFAGWRIASGHNSIGEFASFVTAFMLAAQPLKALGNLNATIQEGASAAVRIFDVLDEQPDIRDLPDAKPLRPGPAEIHIDNVEFSYDLSVPVIRGADLVVQPTSTTALVGRSGAGKSSLFSLMLRFYDPTGGRITIDGQDIRNVSLESLRRSISFVSQDVILFDDSVRTNIAVGALGAGEEAIVAAAKAAAAHDFIMALPDGYETRVGDRGETLSGGERQRIALARAILKDAPILLLDEATSSLDSDAESLIQEALATFAGKKTILVIAHRLSTVIKADTIALMEDGRIVATGTHSSLIKANATYERLCRHQFQLDDEGRGPMSDLDRQPDHADA